VWASLGVMAAAAMIAATGHGSPAIVAAQSGGTVEGVVKLTGTPPPNLPIRMGADPNCLKINGGKRSIQLTVTKAFDGGLADVFVHVQGQVSGGSGGNTQPAVIDQKGCLYQPRVIGARVGQPIQIKNSDTTLHNVKTHSTKGNDLNIGQPQAGMVFNFTPKAQETMLHFQCEVHLWMNGFVGVLTHPYYAVTDTTGSFTITGVPAGKQTIQVWHEIYGPLTQTVDVKAGAIARLNFAYAGTERPSAPAGLAMEHVTIPAGASVLQIVAPQSHTAR
jgi:plastocyanin